MKLNAGDGLAHPDKRPQRYIKALVPLQTTGKNHDQAVIGARPRMRLEDLGVDIIDIDRALVAGAGSGGVFFVPEVIGNDYMVGKVGGMALDQLQGSGRERDFVTGELAGIEFRHDVVDIQNDPGPGHPRVPAGINQEVRHIVNMQEVVGLTAMAIGQPAR